MSLEWAERQLPDPKDLELTQYWAGTRSGELRVQHCPTCGSHQWPPRGACVRCQSLAVGWVSVPQRGQLHSWTVVWHTRLADFVDRVPYAVGIIELGCGIRMIGYVDEDPASLRIDEPLEPKFVDLTAAVTLPIWKRRSAP